MFGYSEKKLAKEIHKYALNFDGSIVFKYSENTNEVLLYRGGDVNSKPISMFLGNLFLKLKEQNRKQREESLLNLLGQLFSERELSPEELKETLAIRVRSEFELNFQESFMKSKDPDAPCFISRKVGELYLQLVSDGDEAVKSVNREQLEAAELSVDDAFRLATVNLARATDLEQWRLYEDGIWFSTYEDDYDFARLVTAGKDVRFPFEGRPVVYSPSHSICLVTNSADSKTLSRMVEIGEEHSANHRPLDQRFWSVFDDYSWQAWAPNEGCEGHNEAFTQNVKELAHQYSEQKDPLQERVGDDIYVAEYRAFMVEDKARSHAVYTIDLPTYLPQTGDVVLYDSSKGSDGEILGKLSWERFLECINAQDSLVEGEIPKRYAILGELTEAQLSSLQGELVEA